MKLKEFVEVFSDDQIYKRLSKTEREEKKKMLYKSPKIQEIINN